MGQVLSQDHSYSDSADKLDPSFTHPRLQDPKTQIRLLEILPAADDDVISCRMTVHTIHDVYDRYVAISYTWGSPDNPKKVKINGDWINVRHNCWLALSQMRKHAPDKLYWIDSICINQTAGHDEKNPQMSLMWFIYSKASGVNISLGDSGPDEPLLNPLRRDSTSSPTSYAAQHPAIQYLCKRPYCRRLWTVQECLLAQELRIFLGTSCCPWHFLTPHLRAGGLEDFVDDIAHYQDPVTESTSLYANLYDPPSGPRNIATLVVRYGNRECFNPRDKIYALISLAPYGFYQKIDIDYAKPLFQVLVDYTASFNIIDCKLLRESERRVAKEWKQFRNKQITQLSLLEAVEAAKPDIRQGELYIILDSIAHLARHFGEHPDFIADCTEFLARDKETNAKTSLDSTNRVTLRGLDLIGACHRICNINLGWYHSPWEREGPAPTLDCAQPRASQDSAVEATQTPYKNALRNTISCGSLVGPHTLRYYVPPETTEGDILIICGPSERRRRFICRPSESTDECLILGDAIPWEKSHLYDNERFHLYSPASREFRLRTSSNTLLRMALSMGKDWDWDFLLEHTTDSMKKDWNWDLLLDQFTYQTHAQLPVDLFRAYPKAISLPEPEPEPLPTPFSASTSEDTTTDQVAHQLSLLSIYGY